MSNQAACCAEVDTITLPRTPAWCGVRRREAGSTFPSLCQWVERTPVAGPGVTASSSWEVVVMMPAGRLQRQSPVMELEVAPLEWNMRQGKIMNNFALNNYKIVKINFKTSLTRISVKLRWLLTVFGFWDVSCEQWVWIPWSVMYSSLTSAETTLDHSWLILTLPESIW